jgi:hypothetical protein
MLVSLFCGCKNDKPYPLEEEETPSVTSPLGVSIHDAMEVAAHYQPSLKDSTEATARKASVSERIVDQKTIVDSVDGKPLLYIFKKDRGFTIVSADMHTMPVLAYSDHSSVDLRNVPDGVQLWLETAKVIREARKDTAPPHLIVAKEWQKFLSRKLKVTDSNCIEWYQYGQFMCKGLSTTKGPLLTTAWGQTALSTTQLSTAGDCDGCGRRVAGCGPVAMAQMQEFYHPDFSRPRFTNGKCTATTAGENNLGTLMKDMGSKANSSYNYMGSCNTFTWPGNVKSGLKSYGFSSGGSGIEAYQYSLIKNELGGNHPVIFWGSTCLDCWSNYHIWICDGYQENYYSEFNCATKQCNEWTFSYLHMNWGWDGGWNDYYAFGQYNPNGNNYNGNLHVISGIRP